MDYVVLRAVVDGVYKAALVLKSDYEEHGSKPSDYFVPSATEIMECGEVQIMGDTDELDPIYETP